MPIRSYSAEAHFKPKSYPSTRRDDASQQLGREAEHRPRADRWTPPQAMGLPDDENFVYRWVREYVRGDMDATNMTKTLREGYEVVRIEDLPPGFLVDSDLHGDGYARHGGLILMRLPREFHEQREAHYRQKRLAAMQGVNELQGIASAESGSRALPVNAEQRRQMALMRT